LGVFLSDLRDFFSRNTDKLLVLFVLVLFYRGAWYGWHYHIEPLASASIDLVKQFAAAFLTLTVSSRLSSPNGGSNASTTSNTNGPASTGK